MNLPPLNALRAFDATARHLSFSRAGDELCVTHAAISHQIRKLEEWFGTALFTRLGRSVELTETGRSLQDQTAPLFETLALGCERLRQRAARSSLSIACVPSIASRWLIPNLARFGTLHPEIDLQVIYAEGGRSEADITIARFAEAEAPPWAKRLCSGRARPVCSPHMPEAVHLQGDNAAIAAAELLHDADRADWQAWCRVAGQPPGSGETGPVFQDFNLLLTAAVAGHGVALCPVDIYREELARGDLLLLSDLSVGEERSYFLTAAQPDHPEIQQFSDWFLSLVPAGGDSAALPQDEAG